jgi:hypothetical protein
MFPCLFHTLMCFIVVQDDILIQHSMLVWAAHADTSPRFHQLLALVTCFPPDASSRLSLSRLDSLHLPEKMHRLCSRNACSPLFFGLALHQIPQPLSFCSTFRLASFSPALRLPQYFFVALLWSPKKIGWPSRTFKERWMHK